MAKNPSDKVLKERLDPEHEITCPANRKKHDAVVKGVIKLAKEVRDLLPDDHGSAAPLYSALEQVSRQSVATFERRSGKGERKPKAAPVRGVSVPATKTTPPQPPADEKPVTPAVTATDSPLPGGVQECARTVTDLGINTVIG